MTKCPKCGYENPENANYCINCGARLLLEAVPSGREADKLLKMFNIDTTFEGFFYIFFTSFIYVLLTVLSKTVWTMNLLLTPNLLCLLLGIYVYAQLRKNNYVRATWFAVLAYSIIGLVMSLIPSYAGIYASLYYLCIGTIIFLIMLVKAFLDKNKFKV